MIEFLCVSVWRCSACGCAHGCVCGCVCKCKCVCVSVGVCLHVRGSVGRLEHIHGCVENGHRIVADHAVLFSVPPL